MYINEILEAWAHTLPFNLPVHAVPTVNENSSLVTFNKQGGGNNPNPDATIGGQTGITGGENPYSGTGMYDEEAGNGK